MIDWLTLTCDILLPEKIWPDTSHQWPWSLDCTVCHRRHEPLNWAGMRSAWSSRVSGRNRWGNSGSVVGMWGRRQSGWEGWCPGSQTGRQSTGDWIGPVDQTSVYWNPVSMLWWSWPDDASWTTRTRERTTIPSWCCGDQHPCRTTCDVLRDSCTRYGSRTAFEEMIVGISIFCEETDRTDTNAVTKSAQIDSIRKKKWSTHLIHEDWSFSPWFFLQILLLIFAFRFCLHDILLTTDSQSQINPLKANLIDDSRTILTFHPQSLYDFWYIIGNQTTSMSTAVSLRGKD